MRITSEMKAETGVMLSTFADFEDAEGTGLKITESPARYATDKNNIVLEVDSYDSLSSRSIALTPDDALELAAMLVEKAAKSRANETATRFNKTFDRTSYLMMCFHITAESYQNQVERLRQERGPWCNLCHDQHYSIINGQVFLSECPERDEQ